ncbi:MAG: GIY-YIG nuclease family protein [Clostridium sp.]|uniref:GIY-YIG nuclease family protein n=1 Tax=Clostridium sp. TaxID=1506 RepID=UPI0025BBA1A5|nr:GIY-YIG nuclease family protein [Clostridium sp.]MBS4956582.1 GIY-YIG nuclease family protein [Clostridium sp.]
MTKEEKRRREHNIYMKEWNKQSESYKEYQREYHREYKKKRKGFYIYFFVNKDGQVVYVGKTNFLSWRMAYHKSTREYWEDSYTVLYHEFKDINDDILVDIESMLISLLNPVKNSKCADYDGNVDKYLKGFNLKEYKM